MTELVQLHAREKKKTPGQIAYEADCAARPFYPTLDKRPRPPWDRLGKLVQSTWEKNPTPRWS